MMSILIAAQVIASQAIAETPPSSNEGACTTSPIVVLPADGADAFFYTDDRSTGPVMFVTYGSRCDIGDVTVRHDARVRAVLDPFERTWTSARSQGCSSSMIAMRADRA